MVSVVTPAVAALGRRSCALAAGLLAIGACDGTQHVVFFPLPPPVTLAPEPMDGAAPPVDSATPAAPDAEVEVEDAGHPPDPDLDRTITFEWNETLPGQGTCRDGRYVGSFTCAAVQDGGVSGSPVSGQVVFTLGPSSEQQVLSITDGALKDPLGFRAAPLSGSLRCTDKVFEAHSVDGMLFWLPFSAFEATLDGVFDDQALVIEGTFAVTNELGEQCMGDFHVSAAP